MPVNEGSPLGLASNALAGLSDHVYDALVSLLLRGELAPGKPIRIETAARQLGVSATPVREALMRMEATGLVHREAHKGFRVAPPPTTAELLLIVEARLVFEPACARLACERRDAKLVDALTRSTKRQLELRDRTDQDAYREFMAADHEFHQAIVGGTHNRHLVRATESLGGHIQRWRAFIEGVPLDRDKVIAEHCVILQAFTAGDPEAASETMRGHLDQLKQRIERQSQHSDPHLGDDHLHQTETSPGPASASAQHD